MAEECLRKAEREPEAGRAELERLARQWTRLAEYAESEQGDLTQSWDMSALARPGRRNDGHGPRH